VRGAYSCQGKGRGGGTAFSACRWRGSHRCRVLAAPAKATRSLPPLGAAMQETAFLPLCVSVLVPVSASHLLTCKISFSFMWGGGGGKVMSPFVVAPRGGARPGPGAGGQRDCPFGMALYLGLHRTCMSGSFLRFCRSRFCSAMVAASFQLLPHLFISTSFYGFWHLGQQALENL